MRLWMDRHGKSPRPVPGWRLAETKIDGLQTTFMLSDEAAITEYSKGIHDSQGRKKLCS